MKYSDFVDYEKADKFREKMKELSELTSRYIEKLGIKVVRESIGGPATLLDFEDYDFYLAFTTDGVGTKSLVANKISTLNDPFLNIGIDLTANNINDLICVGATPFALANDVSVENYDWFEKERRGEELSYSLMKGCEEAQITIPCGETAALKRIIEPDALNLSGSAIGIVKPKERAVLGDKLQEGDVIYGLRSDGIHSNGLSLAEDIVEKLPNGYYTPFSRTEDKEGPFVFTVGEELLAPTFIYAESVLKILDEVDVHYMSHITGSGWRKIMRARKPFTYRITEVPDLSKSNKIFKFLQENGSIDDYEAYQTWNMGIGFVIFAPEEYEDKIMEIAKKHVHEYEDSQKSFYRLGIVEKGEKQVIIEPKNITYK